MFKKEKMKVRAQENDGYIDTKEVTVVVCSWNAEKMIEQCLSSLRLNGVGQILLVDANSEDRTRQIAARYADKILTDPREGLARARNIGIQKAEGKYVLNFGSDNVLPAGELAKMLHYMAKNNYSGVSAMTCLEYTKGKYLGWAMNCYKKARYYPGERPVIGTPTLFETQLLKENPYDDKMGWSDDADLCDRLRAKGHKFAVSDVTVYEVGSENLRSVLYRWRGYGRSDWEIFAKYSPAWSLKRKWQSFMHPLRVEFLCSFLRTSGWRRFAILPFLLLITAVRYLSWIRHALVGQRRTVPIGAKTILFFKIEKD